APGEELPFCPGKRDLRTQPSRELWGRGRRGRRVAWRDGSERGCIAASSGIEGGAENRRDGAFRRRCVRTRTDGRIGGAEPVSNPDCVAARSVWRRKPESDCGRTPS